MEMIVNGDIWEEGRNVLYTKAKVVEILNHYADEAFDAIVETVPEEDTKNEEGKWTTNHHQIGKVLTSLITKYSREI